MTTSREWHRIQTISRASWISQGSLAWPSMCVEAPAEGAPVQIPLGCCGRSTRVRLSPLAPTTRQQGSYWLAPAS